jgi:fructuronate reductase
MPQLTDAALDGVRAEVPAYDRAMVTPGIVHLGLGAFARAHLAVFVDDLLAAGHTDLGIIGVSLRSADVPAALRPQRGLYTVVTVDGDESTCRVIGSVLDVLHAPSQAAVLRAALTAPTTSIVTVTVTEKGYAAHAATRRLDHDHPDVQHDLANPDAPRGLLGHLLAMARDRRATGAGPVTVLSLDNVPANGVALRALVAEMAALADGGAGLQQWIDANVAFPSSMVDRIVPATDDRLRAATAAAIGADDAWPVRAEPYSQWVVERQWATPLPSLAAAGVHVVERVAPWEALKLRVLNALHTAAALYGLRHGLDTVDAVVADDGGLAFVMRVAAEIEPVVVAPDGVDLSAYVATTLRRFANSGLGHRCAQVATDSSQKLPARVLPSVRERLRRGLAVDALTDVVALWAWSTLGRDHAGASRPVADPLASRFAAIAGASGGDPHALAGALVGLPDVFGDLAGDARLVEQVAVRLADLI